MIKSFVLISLVFCCVLSLELHHNQALPNGTNNRQPNNYNNNNYNNYNNNNYNNNNNYRPQLQPSICTTNYDISKAPLVGGRPWVYSGPFKITCTVNGSVIRYSVCYNARDCGICIHDYSNCRRGGVMIYRL